MTPLNRFLWSLLLLFVGGIAYHGFSEPLGIFWLCLAAVHAEKSTNK